MADPDRRDHHDDAAHRGDTAYQDDAGYQDDATRSARSGERDLDDRDLDDRGHEPTGGAGRDASATGGSDTGATPTLVDGSGDLFERWQRVQAGFVDSPRESVHEAGGIVEDVLSRLSNTFDSERRRLDDAWDSGSEPSTEELRMALRRYREFFERLLAA
jgi:hypothetical protein